MEDTVQPWIQTMGRIAIHVPPHEPQTLNGSTRVLLALLVAGGRSGTSIEAIADAYWTHDRPASWAVSMRVAASHLSGLLPDGWTVETDDDSVRLAPSPDGWVDAWRIEDEITPQAGWPEWIEPGPPFAGIEDIALIDEAAHRLVELLGQQSDDPESDCPLSGPLPLTPEGREELRDWLLDQQRILIVATPEKLAIARDIVLEDEAADTHVIVGDRELLMPLGPFAMAFPQLRDELHLPLNEVGPETTTHAWRILADALTAQASQRTQRVLIADAHQLDRLSLELASHLIERGPLRHFSIVLLGNASHGDIRWLDFVGRAVTAGCTALYA